MSLLPPAMRLPDLPLSLGRKIERTPPAPAKPCPITAFETGHHQPDGSVIRHVMHDEFVQFTPPCTDFSDAYMKMLLENPPVLIGADFGDEDMTAIMPFKVWSLKNQPVMEKLRDEVNKSMVEMLALAPTPPFIIRRADAPAGYGKGPVKADLSALEVRVVGLDNADLGKMMGSAMTGPTTGRQTELQRGSMRNCR